jgi:putative molybdopterin biosynthesis protein
MGSHDPMLDLLAQYLALTYPGDHLASANVGSMGGLVALRRKEAHLAGIHLLDERTGEYNVSYVRQHLQGESLQLVTFAHREQGLIVAKGNPKQVRSLDDLSRVTYVNRQQGAGTRLLLDYELKRRGIAPAAVAGYEHEEYTHLAVAAAVVTGIADCGLGVRSAALALDLDFISVGWERYDLVIPAAHLDHPGVQHLLEVVRSSDFQQALSAQPGYDTRETGKVQMTV